MCLLDEQGVSVRVPAGWAGLENASEDRALSRTCTRRAWVRWSTNKTLACRLDEQDVVNVPAGWAGLDSACEGRAFLRVCKRRARVGICLLEQQNFSVPARRAGR